MKGIAATTNKSLKKHEHVHIGFKILEYLGTFYAATGFFLLSENMLIHGFGFGFLSCMCLIPVFLKNKLIPLFCLQVFFFSVNINGILNNWNIT